MNIAQRLQSAARDHPQRLAVVAPAGRAPDGAARYHEWTFRQLDDESDRLAAGLQAMGVRPGMRLVLFVRFSWEFIALTFAMFKAGAVVVLIDPGMGRANIFDCLREVQPDGFVAIPLVQAVRFWKRRQFQQARFNVTVGRRWFWGGLTYAQLLRGGAPPRRPSVDMESAGVSPNSLAAIIFTSGSTGPPKGVAYEHGMFDAQVEMIRDAYSIEPGEIDLPGFPLFGLFNAAMGVTTVIPDMDPTRPANVDPIKILTAIRDWNVTQVFGSPAFWNRVGRYCESSGESLPTVRRALSAGGPVPVHVLRRVTAALTQENADIYTPYGATEALPVASIGGREVLQRTAAATARGRGTCVGRPFPGVEVRIIAVTDEPLASLADASQLGVGEIGEIIVRSRSATREYFQRPQATQLAKIPLSSAAADSPPARDFFHRLGDVGYLDDEGLLWFCGRKAHLVDAPQGRLYSVCCEAIFDEHPRVYRTALVGVGNRPQQTAVIVVEPEPGCFPQTAADAEQLRRELLERGAANPLTASIQTVLFLESLPVDTRHNVKINREALAIWAREQGVDGGRRSADSR